MGFWYFINAIGLSGLPVTKWVTGISYMLHLEQVIQEQKSNNGVLVVTKFSGNPLENKPCKVEVIPWTPELVKELPMKAIRTFEGRGADAMHRYYDRLSTQILVRDGFLV